MVAVYEDRSSMRGRCTTRNACKSHAYAQTRRFGLLLQQSVCESATLTCNHLVRYSALGKLITLASLRALSTRYVAEQLDHNFRSQTQISWPIGQGERY